MRWVEYFYNIANEVKKKSKDKRTQIGAVIVGKNKEIVSTGYNSFPRGIDDWKPERQERPEKYFGLNTLNEALFIMLIVSVYPQKDVQCILTVVYLVLIVREQL